jgi:hypothetical protein
MRITRENYESIFIDYLDGNLPTGMEKDMHAFLRENPDLADELNSLSNISIEPSEIEEYNYKHLLKSDFDEPGVLEEKCIRALENDMSDAERAEFEQYLAHSPKAANEYKLFKATKLIPDESIAYKHISKLKRRKVVPLYWISAAAIIVLAAIFWFSTDTQYHEIPEVQIAELPISFETGVITEKSTPLNLIETPRILAEAKVSEEETSEDNPTETLPNHREVFLYKTLASAEVSIKHAAISEMNLGLATFNTSPTTIPDTEIYPSMGEWLAERVNNIEPRQHLARLTHGVLDRFRDNSNERFDYETTPEGQLARIEYNSRMLAFSVPVNK